MSTCSTDGDDDIGDAERFEQSPRSNACAAHKVASAHTAAEQNFQTTPENASPIGSLTVNQGFYMLMLATLGLKMLGRFIIT